MKRRVQGLVSSTAGRSTKRRAWQEEAPGPGPGRRLVQREGAEEPGPPAQEPGTAGSDEEAWRALEEAAGGEEAPEEAPPSGPNPVVWMDISVAGKPRGRVLFELFRDVVPRTAENFRRLCVGVPEDPKRPDGPRFGYKGTELYKILAGRVAEGGEFDRAATGREFRDENFVLGHNKGGLLSMANDGPHTNTSRFQITFKPLPALDGRQVVFGQVVADEAAACTGLLHPLHWAGAMGTSSGTPLEAVMIEDCGECDAGQTQQLLRPVSGEVPETQHARYSRAGVPVGKLEDAICKETVVDMLELTESVLDSFEWQAKKATRDADNRKAAEVEAGLRALKAVLEEVEFKAGDVQAADGKQGRKAKSQVFRLRDLVDSLGQIY